MPVTLTPEQEAWVASRPPAVQARVRAYPPTQFYRLKDTGQKVWIHSYSETLDGRCDTCRVHTYDDPIPGMTTEVFGVTYENLEPRGTPPEGGP